MIVETIKANEQNALAQLGLRLWLDDCANAIFFVFHVPAQKVPQINGAWAVEEVQVGWREVAVIVPQEKWLSFGLMMVQLTMPSVTMSLPRVGLMSMMLQAQRWEPSKRCR